MRTIVRSTMLSMTLAGIARSVAAQEPMHPQVPQIVTSASAEVRVAPDRASISVGVQTRAATAAEASAQNSRKQNAIIAAIRAKGIPANQIATSGFNVIPETVYDREGRQAPRTTSYLVSNVVNVEVRQIDQVGPVIDASLGAGANQINSLSFSISSADSARRVALTQAVGKARADADAMARAAGGTLGDLIEMSAGEAYMPPRPMIALARGMEMAQDAVPIEPGEETVRATVNARWRFVSGR
ncbi:MAG: SIMPL domain-containing protein [Gemmatimonadaceae bacterium]